MKKIKKKPEAKKTTKRKSTGIDWMLVLIVGILLVFGLIMLYSASSYNSQIKFGTSSWYLRRQFFSTLAGIAVMFGVTFIPLNFWKKVAPLVYGIAVISIFLILTPLGGEEINGAKRWLNLKVISLQPAEIMKIAIIIGMAFFISKFIRFLDDWRMYALCFSICLVGCGLTLFITDDLGTAIIMFAMGFVIMLISSPKVLYLVITAAVSLGAVVGVILLKPNKMVRVQSWLHLDQYADDIGYQITQALYAVGSGGVFGKGLGKSTQKMGFVPESENDMIFSIICEELGIIGGILLIVL
ncbi:MAG: FtsW/RodA/SpoVE family cell cycle protein, partial [Parasporobacterium sp.]|nr:FtsW/RodA/SpoVE family cell cycle protein [Parasporobacterium sp.]